MKSPKYEERAAEEGSEDLENSGVPAINSQQFTAYMLSLVKLLVGEDTLQEWTKKGDGSSTSSGLATVFFSFAISNVVGNTDAMSMAKLNAVI